ncbi:hypothetical protein E4U60_005091 [Claviceps pazoutovae]|uniref:Uncharacterized protein n=1 Tax=Claviceps pazoutovae TaxID=1649127 RepID=A0A9P7M810_9HYPO|nr:hypothetical protein E4U60_005091 [Claviceps pazoutovae]
MAAPTRTGVDNGTDHWSWSPIDGEDDVQRAANISEITTIDSAVKIGHSERYSSDCQMIGSLLAEIGIVVDFESNIQVPPPHLGRKDSKSLG